MKDEYDSFFDIDKNRLDEEWVNHPRIAFKYYKEYETVKIELEEARTELDVVSAIIGKKIRAAPKKYGLPADKLTETAINKTVIIRPKYKEALIKFRKIEYKLSLLKAACKALDHRKSALERLVSLHGQNYFSTPQAQDDVSKEKMDEVEKKNIRSGKKRKKKV